MDGLFEKSEQIFDKKKVNVYFKTLVFFVWNPKNRSDF